MIAAAALLMGLATPAPAPSTDPYQIYKRAIEHLVTLPQPGYVVETQHWVAVTGGDNGSSVWDERAVFDSINRRECVLDVPYTPSEQPTIGESYFAPDMWLVNHRHPAPPAGETNMAPDLSDLKTIANVVSVAAPSYEIRLIGTDSMTHGGSAYHLSLRPKSNPRKHNLRELWIDVANHNIMRAIIEGNYRPSYNMIVRDTFVLEDFGMVGPYWLVIHKVWTYSDPFSGGTIQYNATSLSMSFPTELPDWLFDPKQFARHRNDVVAAIGP